MEMKKQMKIYYTWINEFVYADRWKREREREREREIIMGISESSSQTFI